MGGRIRAQLVVLHCKSVCSRAYIVCSVQSLVAVGAVGARVEGGGPQAVGVEHLVGVMRYKRGRFKAWRQCGFNVGGSIGVAM